MHMKSGTKLLLGFSLTLQIATSAPAAFAGELVPLDLSSYQPLPFHPYPQLFSPIFGHLYCRSGNDNLYCGIGSDSISITPSWFADPNIVSGANVFQANISFIFYEISNRPTKIAFDVIDAETIPGCYTNVTADSWASWVFGGGESGTPIPLTPITLPFQHVELSDPTGLLQAGLSTVCWTNSDPGRKFIPMRIANIRLGYGNVPDAAVTQVVLSQNGQTNPDLKGDGIIDINSGQPVNATVTFSASNLGSLDPNIPVRLCYEESCLDQTLNFSSGSASAQVTFTPVGSGLQNLSASIHSLQGETNFSNNFVSSQVKVVPSYKLVAYVNGKQVEKGGSPFQVNPSDFKTNVYAVSQGDGSRIVEIES